ncbi:zinc metallopeptidase [Hazenella sp. IB182357]|uniref:Zinc metallopeptidase n=1 Tax=Polycladospora coralii TaxID=2771432 RepID=A0A926NCR6_9BACL|nr:zinc metallopeptidase [Polycladospora coralii]MBD1371199.1 zinc metallopeptidase [Polycladospora coralii]
MANLLFIISMVFGLGITLWAQYKVKRNFNKWSKVQAKSGLTGYQVAREILNQNGLSEVYVEPVRGKLTDHYDPTSKTIRLSESVYDSHSISAIAVAAHECGHAIQHQQGYGALVFRHNMIPILNITSGMAPLFLIAGILFQLSGMLVLGIAFFAVVVLFHVVTLPVEFNASSRAKQIMTKSNMIRGIEEERGVNKVLGAAAFTYVAAALVALMELLRYLFILFLQQNDD